MQIKLQIKMWLNSNPFDPYYQEANVVADELANLVKI